MQLAQVALVDGPSEVQKATAPVDWNTPHVGTVSVVDALVGQPILWICWFHTICFELFYGKFWSTLWQLAAPPSTLLALPASTHDVMKHNPSHHLHQSVEPTLMIHHSHFQC